MFGGAGLFTALAAEAAGAQVTMLAPRPDPMPPELAGANGRLEWLGPKVAVEDLPRFEIEIDGAGRARYVDADPGAESDLEISMLGSAAGPWAAAFSIPFAETERQLAMVRELRSLSGLVATGTYPAAAAAARPELLAAIALADVFFCNEEEHRSLFGWLVTEDDSVMPEALATPPGRLRLVTLGARGALVVQGSFSTRVVSEPVREAAPAKAAGPVLSSRIDALAPVTDPTGGGDMFCGAALAGLARREHPVLVARRGVSLASRVLGAGGRARLLSLADEAGAGGASEGVWSGRLGGSGAVRETKAARVDQARVQQIGRLLSGNHEVTVFGFVGPWFPDPEEEGALELFFAVTVLQFGFWHDDGRAYAGPMWTRIGGDRLKGSDALFAAFLRWLRQDRSAFTPERLAALRPEELERRLAADDGVCPFPQMAERWRLLSSYGEVLKEWRRSPAAIVTRANEASEPLGTLLVQLDHLPGLREDPLRKKAMLLAAILRQRPERWLDSSAGPSGERPDELAPIVDYHVQRSCLRMGLVRIEDPQLRGRLEARRLLTAAEHDAVREASYLAVAELASASGLSMGAVDFFLFQNRSRCPEMSEPECDLCPVEPECARATGLFQPVRRVTWY